MMAIMGEVCNRQQISIIYKLYIVISCYIIHCIIEMVRNNDDGTTGMEFVCVHSSSLSVHYSLSTLRSLFGIF